MLTIAALSLWGQCRPKCRGETRIGAYLPYWPWGLLELFQSRHLKLTSNFASIFNNPKLDLKKNNNKAPKLWNTTTRHYVAQQTSNSAQAPAPTNRRRFYGNYAFSASTGSSLHARDHAPRLSRSLKPFCRFLHDSDMKRYALVEGSCRFHSDLCSRPVTLFNACSVFEKASLRGTQIWPV